ncbi:MAG: hypothetical protein R2705_00085 [Ilumatobacteraceae bacterium]
MGRHEGGRSVARRHRRGGFGDPRARTLGAEFFLTPWNPWMPVLAYLCFLVLVFAAGEIGWGAALLRPSSAPTAQTHVSYVVLVYGMLGLLLVWMHREHAPMSGRSSLDSTWAAIAAP